MRRRRRHPPAPDLRPARPPGQPGRPRAGRGRASARATTVGLHLHNGHPFIEADAGLLQAAGRPGERELPLRGRRAGLPVRRRRPGACCVTEPELAAEGRRRARTATEPAARSIVVGADYEARLARPARTRSRGVGPRSADDRYVLYTGGTTGPPKGVVWRHEDIYFASLGGRGTPSRGVPAAAIGPTRSSSGCAGATRSCGGCRCARSSTAAPCGWRCRPCSTAAPWCSTPAATSTPTTALDLLAGERVELTMLIGDATARPLADALAADRARPDGGRFDLSALQVIASGGAVLSASVKDQLRSAAARHQGGRHVRRLRDRRSGPAAARRRQAARPGCSPTSTPRCSTTSWRPVGARPGRATGPLGVDPARLPRRPRAQRGHLPGGRRRALVGARRPGPPRGRRHHHPAGPGLDLDQHRRREGLPRGGGERAQGPPRRVRRAGGGRARRALRRAGGGRGVAAPAARRATGCRPTDAELEAHVPRPRGRLQGAPRRGSGWRTASGCPPASPTTAGPGTWPSRRRGSVAAMRAVVLESYGDPEVLTLRDVPDPEPGPEEVVVEVVATALNRADLLQRRGLLPRPAHAPGDPRHGAERSGAERGGAGHPVVSRATR